MNDVYIIRDQEQRFFDKSGDWSHGEDRRAVFRTALKDEAINQMVELSVKNPTLRVSIETVSLDAKGLPEITPIPGAQRDAPDSEENQASENTLFDEQVSA